VVLQWRVVWCCDVAVAVWCGIAVWCSDVAVAVWCGVVLLFWTLSRVLLHPLIIPLHVAARCCIAVLLQSGSVAV